MIFIDRKISEQLQSAATFFPAIVLTGARQTGKTTLLRSFFPHHHYVSLDRPSVAEQAENDPESFLAQHPAPLMIDEVQYAPSLFRHLKVVIDENRHLKGQFILTGSQKFTLMKGVSESLAGRAAILELEGLSCLELRDAGMIGAGGDQYRELLIRGGFPELWVERARPLGLFIDSYIATYLERDVKQVLAVSNLRDFERFLRACALRSAQQLNKSDLARDVGISVTTVGEWLSVLEALGQIVLLEPWFANLTKRLVKTPKLYFCETSLMCALAGVTLENIDQSPLIDAIWENYVFAELSKQICFMGLTAKLWYYRDQSQNEVDFILEQGHQLTLYECKWTSSPRPDMGKNIQKVTEIFAQSSRTPYEIIDRVLVNRAIEIVRGKTLSYRSPLGGLVGTEKSSKIPRKTDRFID